MEDSSTLNIYILNKQLCHFDLKLSSLVLKHISRLDFFSISIIDITTLNADDDNDDDDNDYDDDDADAARRQRRREDLGGEKG